MCDNVLLRYVRGCEDRPAHGVGEGLHRVQVREVERQDGDVRIRHGVAAVARPLHAVHHRRLARLHVAAAQEHTAAGVGERLDGLQPDARVSTAERDMSARTDLLYILERRRVHGTGVGPSKNSVEIQVDVAVDKL